jgi:2'-5' RNA ligase
MSTGDSQDVFIRAFIALDVGEAVRGQLAAVQASLKKTHAHVSWVPPDNIHLSLVFLGNITQDLVGLVQAALDQAAAGTRPFPFRVVNLGTFGGRQSPRVIWAGTSDNQPIKDLHGLLVPLLKEIGLTPETREFTPHITLGRVRSGRGRDDLVQALEAAGPRDFGPVDAREVRLMRSVLWEDGARYSVLHRAPFSG